MNPTHVFILLYFVSSIIYGFGKISRGAKKDAISGFGILCILLVMVGSFLYFPFKNAVILLIGFIFIINFISGLIMSVLEKVLYKSDLEARKRVSERYGVSEAQLEKWKNQSDEEFVNEMLNRH